MHCKVVKLPTVKGTDPKLKGLIFGSSKKLKKKLFHLRYQSYPFTSKIIITDNSENGKFFKGQG